MHNLVCLTLYPYFFVICELFSVLLYFCPFCLIHRKIKSFNSNLHLLLVIHARDSQHSLGNEEVVTRVGILAQKSHVVVFGVERAHELVEDVVITFDLKLEGNTRLFQKVSLDIGGGDLACRAKVNTNELTLKRK